MNLDVNKQQQKIARLIAELRKHIRVPLPVEPVLFAKVSDEPHDSVLGQEWCNWERVSDDFVWGSPNTNTWFAARITGIPETVTGRVVAEVETRYTQLNGRRDPQGQVWLNGVHYQAINGYHRDIDIPQDCRGARQCDVHIKAYKSEAERQVGIRLALHAINEEAEQLYYDLSVPFDVARRLPEQDARKYAVLNIVERALRTLDFRAIGSEEFQASLAPAREIAAEIYALKDTEEKPTVVCTGHTHIDVAWQWTVGQTREKTVRSFSTVLDLMDRHPDFVFMYNQCVLFDYLKQDAPDLYERALAKVRNGQLEIEGAMWLEPDMNIISGESIVRHILYGTHFHEREFGVTPKIVWLPDTFGYAASMPQVLAKSGIEFFVTSKLSWNDTNRMPFDTFFWKGIDGTPINSYLLTAQELESEKQFTSYQPDLDASIVMGTWKRYEPKKLNDEVLLVYGHGDGGGGPTDAMIEQVRRMERGIPGCPTVKIEGIGPFFERIGARMAENTDRFPVWNGELYLEFHRGTLTSVARTKRFNRRAEDRMRDCELLGVLAMLGQGASGYGAKDIRRFWDVVMLQQFHDILPGTSIGEVYRDSDRDYEALFSETSEYLTERVSWVAAPAKGDVTLVNALGRARRNELVLLDDGQEHGTPVAVNAGSERQPVQSIVRADGRHQFLVPVEHVPALGWKNIRLEQAVETPSQPTGLSVSKMHLENERLRVEFTPAGEISSVWDKQKNRELLQDGETANRLTVYEDKPMDWDAWDIDWYFEEKSWPVGMPESMEVAETGPHRVALRLAYRYRNSTIVQVVSLARGSAVVEFDTYADWNEDQSVLKAEFPFDLNCSSLRSEIQFGHVVRPTTRNTSWERARFEASMHRWVDMSESDFGAALLNDCKYGYDAHEQRIRLTLIKSGTWPFPDADIGEHHFRYGLAVHHGTFGEDDIPALAEAFSNPVTCIGVPTVSKGNEAFKASEFGLVEIDRANVSVEAIKKAEDTGHVILRLCEIANVRTKANITFAVPIVSADVVNLLEREAQTMEVTGGHTVGVELRPFEIVTLRVEFAPGDGLSAKTRIEETA